MQGSHTLGRPSRYLPCETRVVGVQQRSVRDYTRAKASDGILIPAYFLYGLFRLGTYRR